MKNLQMLHVCFVRLFVIYTHTDISFITFVVEFLTVFLYFQWRTASESATGGVPRLSHTACRPATRLTNSSGWPVCAKPSSNPKTLKLAIPREPSQVLSPLSITSLNWAWILTWKCQTHRPHLIVTELKFMILPRTRGKDFFNVKDIYNHNK